MVRVCVEGNIGCGKSTALAALAARRPDLAVFPEPVDEWVRSGLLSRYYADQARWALPFSLTVLLSFVPPARCERPCVVERSPLSCRHVFSQLLFNDGKLAQDAWELFKEYCDVLGWKPDVLVYVQTPADECHRRKDARGRAAEAGVDLQHLKRLEFQYETMLRYADIPVVRVDGTAPPQAVAAAIEAVVDRALGARGGGAFKPPPRAS